MPQLQNLVLTDRADTPVNHTFVPRGITGNIGEVVESSGVPIGDSRLTISLNKTSGARYKAVLKLEVPVVQTATINGIDTPSVVRKAYAECTFSFDSTSTEQERDDLVGMLASALAADKPLINDTIVKLQGIF